MPRSRRRGNGSGLPRGAQYALVAALAVVAVLLVGYVVHTGGTTTTPSSDANGPLSPATPTASASSAKNARVLFVLGDAFSTGTRANSGLEWPDILANEQPNLTVVKDVAGGSGVLSASHKRGSFLDRNPADVRKVAADVVIISGGQIDYPRHSISQIAQGAGQLLDQWHAGNPTAKLVLFSPFSPQTPPSPTIVAMAKAFAAVATQHHATYIDVTQMIPKSARGSDGIHPTTEGHRLLAKEITAALKAEKLL